MPLSLTQKIPQNKIAHLERQAILNIESEDCQTECLSDQNATRRIKN
jgi:hypothetical protein